MELRGWAFTLILWLLCLFGCPVCQETGYEGIHDEVVPEQTTPTVMIAVLVRNKAHILPYFLHYLQELDYPKNRIALWIRSDHNVDNSAQILQAWLDQVSSLYHSVDFVHDSSVTSYQDEQGACHWSNMRFKHVIKLRQQALEAAREMWADSLFMVDADCLLLNRNVLSNLLAEEKTVIAPLMNTTASEHYSNYWCAMDNYGYYKRTGNYMPLLRRQFLATFPVAMVHTAILINMHHQKTDLLAYDPPPPNYNGPLDDIIIFAHSAKFHRVPMHIINKEFYGLMQVPMEPQNALQQEQEQLVHMKNQAMLAEIPLQKLEYIDVPVPEPSTLGFDQIYMINLKRRPDRREKMEFCFRELGIKAKLVPAVDGKELNDSYLKELGIHMLPNYADPYHKRPLTMGEIGCFLSHYFIWQDVVKNNYQKVIVFEDDIRFKPFFNSKLGYMMWEVERGGLDWDLLYLGRKRLKYNEEAWVKGTDTLVHPHYSYWTLSYAISLGGATKLLDQQPLAKMVPVDEYLPIMFDRHPTPGWKEAFSPRDLLSLSAEPLLVEPTHYTGEPGYITDTEDSDIIGPTVIKGVGVIGPGVTSSKDEL